MKTHDRVRINNERGYYWVWDFRADGSVTVFGGSRDPGGLRRHRTVTRDQLRSDERDLPQNLYPTTLRGE